MVMHDPVEKYTLGRTHDGTVHVWIHSSVVGNSFGGKLFVDGSLMCKHGSQGGQAGWAVAQIHETSHESVCSARVPCRSRSQCSDVSCGQNCGRCGRPSFCRSQERHSFLTVPRCSEAWNEGRNGAQRRGGRMLTCGGKSETASKTLETRPTSTP